MNWPRKKKSGNSDIYYILPGMNRSNRRVRRLAFIWSVVVALLTSAALCAALYFLGRH